jgi:hypothetical protein
MACVKGWVDKIKIGHVNKFHYWSRLEHGVEFFNSCSFPNKVFKGNGETFPLLLIFVVYHFSLQVYVFQKH